MAGLSDDQVFDSDRMLGLIQKEILKAADEGNCVLVGRGAACALANRPGCFHVFVYATAAAKRAWFMQAFPKQADQADHLLSAFDKRRAAVIRKAYQQEWCARGLYHLLLNSCIGNEAMIAAVSAATTLESVRVEACAEVVRAARSGTFFTCDMRASLRVTESPAGRGR